MTNGTTIRGLSIFYVTCLRGKWGKGGGEVEGGGKGGKEEEEEEEEKEEEKEEEEREEEIEQMRSEKTRSFLMFEVFDIGKKKKT